METPLEHSATAPRYRSAALAAQIVVIFPVVSVQQDAAPCGKSKKVLNFLSGREGASERGSERGSERASEGGREGGRERASERASEGDGGRESESERLSERWMDGVRRRKTEERVT